MQPTMPGSSRSGVTGFRSLNRWGRRKGEAELLRLLQTVALEAESRLS